MRRSEYSNAIERRSHRIRIPVMAAATIVALWLGYVIVGNTIAATTTDPVEALTVRPGLSSALITLAEERLAAADDDGTLAEVERLARTALAGEPLQARSLRLLGLVADIRDETVRADALVRLAAERVRRDALSQLWLLERDLNEQRLVEAADRIDVILRARPDMRPMLLPAAATLVRTSTGRDAFVRHLDRDPPWRSWLLNELPKASEPFAVHALLKDLQTSRVPLNNNELRPFIEALISSKQFDFAYLVWVGFLPAEVRSALPYMFNGSFEAEPSGIPFDWSIANIKGATTDVADRGDGTGRSLRVTFAGTRVEYRHVRKLLVLPPGRYAFSGMERADALENERGLAWRLKCAGRDGDRIAEGAPLSGTVPWRRFSVGFVVPPRCPAQWLSLEILARIPSEEQIAGEVWYDELAIERAAPSSS